MLERDQSLPVFTKSLAEINAFFNAFNLAYESVYCRYAKEKTGKYDGYGEDMILKLVLERPILPDEGYIYPDYMREFLGFGIVHSYTRPTAKKIDHPSSARVGLALSKFHGNMRTIGKYLGYDFNIEKLSPAHLTQDCLAEIEKKGGTPAEWVEDFKEILVWLWGLDHPTHKAKWPKAYAVLDKEQEGIAKKITADIEKRFFALAEFPIILQGKELCIRNQSVPVTIETADEIESYAEKYDVPTAAIFWCVKPAGKAITTRQQGSVAREFLQHTFGLAKEAGRKIELLQSIIYEQQPGFYWDYNREGIHDALYEQRYWIKTAAMSEIILGNDRAAKSFEVALAMIGEEPTSFNFYSANKAAVLLFSTLERLIEYQAKNLNIHKQDIFQPESIDVIKDFLQKISDIGLQTETDLINASQERIKNPDAIEEYNKEKIAAYKRQESLINRLFERNPEFSPVLLQMSTCIGLMSGGNISSDAKRCMLKTVGFCLSHLNIPKKLDLAADVLPPPSGQPGPPALPEPLF